MSMHHCFDHGTVVSDLRSTDKFDALGELIRTAPVFDEIADRRLFEQAVIARERLHTTGFGHGVAVAHGRVAGVQRVLIALGVSRAGIPFGSPDGEPVRLLFVIASPHQVSLDYLQALSTLVRCVRREDVRDALLAAKDAPGIEAAIRSAFAAQLEPSAAPATGRQPCGTAG
jgi:nitrogen PTS system EIIA component